MAKKTTGGQRPPGISGGAGAGKNVMSGIQSVLAEQSAQLNKVATASKIVQQEQSKGAQGQASTIAAKLAQQQLEMLKDIKQFLQQLTYRADRSLTEMTQQTAMHTKYYAVQRSWMERDKVSKQTLDKLYDKLAGKGLQKKPSGGLGPEAMMQRLLSPLAGFAPVGRKIEELGMVQRAKAMGSEVTPAEMKMQASRAMDAKQRREVAERQMAKFKQAGATDNELEFARPDLKRIRDENARIEKEARERMLTSGQPTAKATGGDTSQDLVKTPSDFGKVAQSTTDKVAEEQFVKENRLEEIKLMEVNNNHLAAIVANTSGRSDNSSAGGVEDAGGTPAVRGITGALSGIGKGLGMTAQAGRAVGASIGGVFGGIMEGLTLGIKAFSSVKVILGSAVMGGLVYIVSNLSTALEGFRDLDWVTIEKGGVVLTGLVAAGLAAGAAVAPMLLGATAITAMGGAIWAVGFAMDAMGSGLEKFVNGLDRLSMLEWENLNHVAHAMKGLGGALVSFGVGEAAAGLGNLVSRFLTIGTDSPIEQLQKIGKSGEGVALAGHGLKVLATALQSFQQVDRNAMDVVRDFPWEQATKFVHAGGAMQLKGVQIYDQSKAVMDMTAQVKAQGMASASTGSGAKVQINQPVSNTTNVQKQSVFHNDRTIGAYRSGNTFRGRQS